LIKKDDLEELLIPVGKQASSQPYESRKAVVDRILALRKQFVPRGIHVDALIDQSRQERDRE